MKKVPGVYILQSKKNFRYYIGSTDNINLRLQEHNLGKVRATVNLRPLELKLFYPCETLKQARQLEYKIKRLKRRDLIERMIKDQTIKLFI